MSRANVSAAKLCLAATEDDSIPNAAMRIAAWVVGVALRTNGFPVEVSHRDIRSGIRLPDGNLVAGTKCHHDTIASSLSLLKDKGLIRIEEGKHRKAGHHSMLITVF